MSTSSVSKGCFVFKPSASKRRKTSDKDFFSHGCDSGEDSALRYKLFKELWDTIKDDAETLQKELDRDILYGLLQFIRKCRSNFQHKTNDWVSRMKASEIPTAALVLGVNVSDHDLTIQSVCELLQQSVTPHVASLQAKECGTLKNLMQQVVKRLRGTAVDDEDEDEHPDNTHAHQQGAHCNLATLCEWYENQTKKSNTPSNKPGAAHEGKRPPIVIIFKDLEAFIPRVLQDFIQICSRYVEQIPLVLVFGIATSTSIIQQVLRYSVCSLLCIEVFQSLSSNQHLSAVVDKMILTHHIPFKLSGKVLQVLVSIFLYHDFSVKNFFKGLKLALLEHFLSQPLSVLCCGKEAVAENMAQLSHQGLESLRQLPSFRRYVEQQQPQEQMDLLTNDEHMRDTCQKLLEDLHKYHKNYYPVLKCLHIFTIPLPNSPLGKQIRELHMMCLEGSVWENEEYQSAMQLLRMIDREELVTELKNCKLILKPCKSKKMMAVLAQIQQLLDKFEHLDETKPAASVDDDNLRSPGKLQKKTDLYQLQKTLLDMETPRTKKRSRFEILRNETLEFIDGLVRSHLGPPETQPLHEVCYYSGSAVLRRQLNAIPRTSVQTALSSPYLYLQSNKLLAEDGRLSITAPDICIVHMLHLECGRLINLYDWLQAFVSVASAAEGKDLDSEDYGKVDELKRARFIHAVTELEFLGFIKSTKQKTDHVARLTWGAC